MITSILTKNQKQVFIKNIKYDGENCIMKVTIRYDDECSNGHNTFAITGDIIGYDKTIIGGCIHDEIGKYFPEFKHLIKWHLVSSDGPLYYIEDTIFYAKGSENMNMAIGEPPNLEAARNCAIWPNATLKQLQDKNALMARLPKLMKRFKKDIEALGFTY